MLQPARGRRRGTSARTAWVASAAPVRYRRADVPGSHPAERRHTLAQRENPKRKTGATSTQKVVGKKSIETAGSCRAAPSEPVIATAEHRNMPGRGPTPHNSSDH